MHEGLLPFLQAEFLKDALTIPVVEDAREASLVTVWHQLSQQDSHKGSISITWELIGSMTRDLQCPCRLTSVPTVRSMGVHAFHRGLGDADEG